MPFTPFHIGPSSWIGLLFFRILNLPAFLFGSVISDLEPLFVIIFKFNYPLHGFFHSFLGGTILSIPVSLLLYRFDSVINKIMSSFGLAQETNLRSTLFSVLFGVYSHVFLDAFLYTDIKPFYPFNFNPLYNEFAFLFVYLFCSISFIFGFAFYCLRIKKVKTKAWIITTLSILAVLVIGVKQLQWAHSPFDDGPFKGVNYSGEITGTPDSRIKLHKTYFLEAYNKLSDKAPVLVLRDKANQIIWAKLYTASGDKRYINTTVKELELFAGRKTFKGFQAIGGVNWTFGHESTTIYLFPNGDLDGFYLSW